MGTFGQILLGAILIAVGIITIIKNYQVANSLPLRWLESKIGPGSSYMLWKLFSIVLIFAGFSVMFGFADNILTWLFSPITNAINPNRGE